MSLNTSCCPDGNCGTAPVLPRRDFLRLSALATVAAPLMANADRIAGWVPIDKGSSAEALQAATEWSSGDELKYIGMPVGGICAGTVYLGGDGKLWLWDIFNRVKLGTLDRTIDYAGEKITAGGGANYVDSPLQTSPFDTNFAIQCDGKTRTLDAKGWSDVQFRGDYPIGEVRYRDVESPIEVDLQAFSPFIPLDEDSSELPMVLMRYKVKNTSAKAVTISIGGWLQNPIGIYSDHGEEGTRINRALSDGVSYSLELPKQIASEIRPPIAFEEWSGKDFGKWKLEGTAFGSGPVANVSGRPGVKSFRMEGGDTNLQADARVGKLTSSEFRIERRYVEFEISGGNYPETIYIALIVDGKKVRTATGNQTDALRTVVWDVREFAGRTAHLEIVDAETAFWGQISIGRIRFGDTKSVSLKDAPDFGDMALVLLDGTCKLVHLDGAPETSLFSATPTSDAKRSDLSQRPLSGITSGDSIAPGEERVFTFAIAWRFHNLTLAQIGHVGNHYATRFDSAGALTAYARKELKRLVTTTQKWRDTYYDSTLPRWFLDRSMASASILASMTCVRFENGRFYGWEGIGCCDGTCGHVWQYAHAVGRLFPGLERSVRTMADFQPGVGFHEESGLIDFRGEYGFGYAADAQAGYVLRAYREHQTSKDSEFLDSIYPQVRQALEFLVREDKDGNGVLEGRQHNTLDVDLYGPSSWLTSLYLAALRAGEEMANEVEDRPSAKRWREIFDRGSAKFDDLFFNGDYYIHRLDRSQHPDAMRIGDGCEIDQLMGQQWALQLGLGRIVRPERAKKALKSLFTNNFLPDVSTIRKVDPRGRWYGMPGESGLLMCTFPKGDRKEILGEKPTWASMYFNEVWTGQEYQAASHMIHEGLVEEGLRVMRAVHDRHHPAKRNPYNEVECSDHYARAMASYAAFVAASGFEYHGPKGRIAFAPKIDPSDFRCAFTGAEGWGTYRQKQSGRKFEASISLAYGALELEQIEFETPANGKPEVTLGGKRLAATIEREGDRTIVRLPKRTRIQEGETMLVKLSA